MEVNFPQGLLKPRGGTGGLRTFFAPSAEACNADCPAVRCGSSDFAAGAEVFGMKGGRPNFAALWMTSIDAQEVDVARVTTLAPQPADSGSDIQTRRSGRSS